MRQARLGIREVASMRADSSAAWAVRKTPASEPYLHIKTIDLPRRVRDKHRGRLSRKAFSAGGNHNAGPEGDYAFFGDGAWFAYALAPVARYQPSLARAISKWLLSLSINSRLFWPDSLPDDQQCNPGAETPFPATLSLKERAFAKTGSGTNIRKS